LKKWEILFEAFFVHVDVLLSFLPRGELALVDEDVMLVHPGDVVSGRVVEVGVDLLPLSGLGDQRGLVVAGLLELVELLGAHSHVHRGVLGGPHEVRRVLAVDPWRRLR